jgi:hypothetical protein
MKLSHFEAIKEDSVPGISIGTAEAGTVGIQGVIDPYLPTGA